MGQMDEPERVGGAAGPVKQVGHRLAEEMLLNSGWRLTDFGWKHPDLFFPWPLWHALRVQREMEKGAWKP